MLTGSTPRVGTYILKNCIVTELPDKWVVQPAVGKERGFIHVSGASEHTFEKGTGRTMHEETMLFAHNIDIAMDLA